MSRLTISQAQQFYDEHGSELLSDYRSIVEVIRRHRIESPLDNSNYLHALLLTQLMLEHTSHQFRMLTGGMLDGFVGTLRTSFRQMLERIRDNSEPSHARVLVIVDGEESASEQEQSASCEALRELYAEFPCTLEIQKIRLQPGTSLSHFIVGDHDMVRDEQPHQPLDPRSDSSLVRADVSFYSPTKARLFMSRFDTFWEASQASLATT